ncbi:MAG TPA: OmpA family protein [Kiritimatiellia bacterium]
MIGVVACSLVMTGCKSKKKGAGAGGEDIGGVSGTDVYGNELGGRMDGTEQAGLFSAVYFDYDSAQVNPSERTKLDGVAEHLRANGSQTLTVEGHGDERGSNEYNLALGERRALAIRAYLIGLGIDGSRVQTKSYGEERPLAMGHDEASWSQNRRGEFVIIQ